MNTCQVLLLTLSLGPLSMGFTPDAQAKDLGVVGQVFPISEIDMLQWIQQRLRTFEQTGELGTMKQQFKETVTASVRRPSPVGLVTTTSPEVFTVDPSLTLASDIRDTDGTLIYPKGTRINPFDTTTWPAMQQASKAQFQFSKTLVFFDGDDVQQSLWALDYQAAHEEDTIKWILTGGEPETTHHQLNSRIYFDQHGSLSRKLTLKRVPSVVKQVGILWQVQEIDVSSFPLYAPNPIDTTKTAGGQS